MRCTKGRHIKHKHVKTDKIWRKKNKRKKVAERSSKWICHNILVVLCFFVVLWFFMSAQHIHEVYVCHSLYADIKQFPVIFTAFSLLSLCVKISHSCRTQALLSPSHTVFKIHWLCSNKNLLNYAHTDIVFLFDVSFSATLFDDELNVGMMKIHLCHYNDRTHEFVIHFSNNYSNLNDFI